MSVWCQELSPPIWVVPIVNPIGPIKSSGISSHIPRALSRSLTPNEFTRWHRWVASDASIDVSKDEPSSVFVGMKYLSV